MWVQWFMHVCRHACFRSLVAESRSIRAINCSVRDGRCRILIPEVHISWAGYTVYRTPREFIIVQREIYYFDSCTKYLCVCVCQGVCKARKKMSCWLVSNVCVFNQQMWLKPVAVQQTDMFKPESQYRVSSELSSLWLSVQRKLVGAACVMSVCVC